jgi:hypothetical protein
MNQALSGCVTTSPNRLPAGCRHGIYALLARFLKTKHKWSM